MTKRIADLEAEGPVAYAAKRAAVLCAEGGAAAAVVALVREQMARLTPAGLRIASALFARADLPSLLGGSAHPMAFLAAEADRIVPAARLNEMAALLDRDVTLLTGVGHAAYAEDPAQFVQAVTAAFAGLPEPAQLSN